MGSPFVQVGGVVGHDVQGIGDDQRPWSRSSSSWSISLVKAVVSSLLLLIWVLVITAAS